MERIGNPAASVNQATIAAVHKAADEGRAAGLCLLPPSEDGVKRPLPNKQGIWAPYQNRIPTDEEHRRWYPGRSGIGMVVGPVSSHRETWDFDDRPTYEAFKARAEEAGLGHVVARIEAGYCDDTGGGGVRWVVEYPVDVIRQPGAGIKLACRPTREEERKSPNDKVKTLVELPGYAILAPSNGKVHPSGRPYARRSGSFGTIVSYTMEERDALIELARSFDQMPREERRSSAPKPAIEDGDRPGDEFNAATTWDALLTEKGWARVFTQGGVTHWRRPGKTVGISATTNYKDSDLFYPFSTSTEFNARESYTRFAFYTVTEHRGDFSAAASALARRGYGKKHQQRAASSAAPPSDAKPEYEEMGGGIVWHHKGGDGSSKTIKLTNFTARIVAEITLDDDVEESKLFEIESHLLGRVKRFTVPAHQFASLGWASEKLGARAIVQPGQMIAKRAEVAIRVLSGEIPEIKVYAHTGWRSVGDQRVFLHAGGALGPQGPHSDIRVSLPRELSRYHFPDIVENSLREDVDASLALRRVAPDRITALGIAAAYRAVLGGTDMSGHFQGQTGYFKTEVLALLQQHFGPSMDARHLPASWSATDNRLELLASQAKDVLLGVDDFVLPANATAQDRARLMSKADRVIRAQGNNSARGRLRADLSMRPERPPRGLIMSTGEETPAGASLRARMAVAEVRAGDIDEDELTIAQQRAAAGVYARAMAGFIRWLAPQIEKVQAEFKTLREERRRQFESGHKRSTDVFAQLSATWTILLRFATAIEAVTPDERAAIEAEIEAALEELLTEQEELQASADPIGRFADLIKAALVAGKAHVANATLKGHGRPDDCENWGWRQKVLGMEVTWHPQGDCMGWVDADGLYLEPEVAFDVARRMAGGDFSVTAETLLKRMADRKLLLTTETRGKRRRLKVRKAIAGDRQYVIHVSHSITGPPPMRRSGPCGPSGPEAP